MGIDNSYVAYCLDEATGYWGNYVQGKLEEITGKNRRSIEMQQNTLLGRLLDLPDEQRFKSLRPKSGG